jgi:(1->4)-alpha-D-glucan 1-alpha-D-glucosylmutase
MTRPTLTATYRVQVHKEFPLGALRDAVPYLARLGVSHVYTSPILQARPGSTHGYDVADPSRTNPELGGEEAREALVRAIRAEGLGFVLDIVPNHMGTGPDNPYWEDVLTHGRASVYAPWFDIDWRALNKESSGRVVLPVLGERRLALLERGEFGVALTDRGVRLAHKESSWPLDPATLPPVLDFVLGRVGNASGRGIDALRQARDLAALLPPRTTRERAALERRRADAARIVSLMRDAAADAAARRRLEKALKAYGEGEAGRRRMSELVEAQPYLLVFWRRASQLLNYRRFFDVNELAALHMHDERVFGAVHARVLEWVADGSLDALRIDHIDGLGDPLGYLTKLRQEVDARADGNGKAHTNGKSVPIFVEKILSPGEHLRREWPVAGTTGYETLNDIESLFIDAVGFARLERSYHRFLGRRRAERFHDVAVEAKGRILRGPLAPDVVRLARLLRPVFARDAGRPAPALAEAAEAIVAIISELGVYRTYIDDRRAEPHPEDRRVLEAALARARTHRDVSRDALERIGEVLLHPVVEGQDPEERRQRLAFVRRFQQTSGPATAKGVEDTALYRYLPLLSRNEVGGDPERELADAPARVHAANAERARDWPLALVCTSTHDTKRSGDVRARLDLLAELPDEWDAAVRRWRGMATALRGVDEQGRTAPDANTEWLLYQTLVGAWPLDGAPDDAALAAFEERVQAYMQKALREAKARTSWLAPREGFEKAVAAFVRALLVEPRGAALRDEIRAFAGRLARPGLWNALSRVVVHLAAPGTPDLYQGDDLWNFSLVDPDNRRPVDYALRGRLLEQLERAGKTPARLVGELLARPDDGRIKLWVTTRILRERRERPAPFVGAGYEPIEATGAHARSVFAFLRRGADGSAALVVVARLPLAVSPDGGPPVGALWRDTRLALPAALARRGWRSVLGAPALGGAAELAVSDALGALPVAVFVTA